LFDRTPARSSLTAENARLKKLLAERDLEIELMKEIAVNGRRSRVERHRYLP
jgi:hypothetical protein